MKIRIYYEDTDLGGVVYHSKYLNFCERARSEIFFRANKTPLYGDYHFVVKEIEAKFHKPAYFGDVVEVQTELLSQKGALVKLSQKIYRDRELLFEMDITLVCLKGKRPARIPDYFKELFDRLQS